MQAKEYGLGLAGGGTFLQGDIGSHWHSTPNVGVSFLYPFHPKVPVSFTIVGGKHLPVKGKTEFTVLLLSMALQFEYAFFHEKALSPLVAAGFSNTMFVAFKEWPPQTNDDESELGLCFGSGFTSKLPKNFKFSLLYNQHIVATEPKVLPYGTLTFRILKMFGGKK